MNLQQIESVSLKDYVITENRAVVRNNVVITALRNVTLTRAQFLLFAAQRAYVATNFIRLVEKGLELARALGDAALARALQSNLDDEAGIGPAGIALPQLNHRNWKINYVEALGLQADVPQFPLLDTTRAHVEAFLEQERTGTVFSIAGTLLSLENIIPLEYRAAVVARDRLFPEVFCVTEADDEAARARKLAARQYMDDHIVHDSKSHFPDLLRPLLAYEGNALAMAEMKRGIDVVNAFRKRFYAGLNIAMRFGPQLMEFYTFGK